MPLVYKITNKLNNKSYIGWTGKDLNLRWEEHTYDALRKKDNRKFYNAIRKYGIDVWNVKILKENLNIEEAKNQEIRYIELFDSYHNGYNSTKGGDGNNGIIMSEKSNQARSLALKGKKKNYDRMKNKKLSQKVNLNNHMVKKWLSKSWELD